MKSDNGPFLTINQTMFANVEVAINGIVERTLTFVLLYTKEQNAEPSIYLKCANDNALVVSCYIRYIFISGITDPPTLN